MTPTDPSTYFYPDNYAYLTLTLTLSLHVTITLSPILTLIMTLVPTFTIILTLSSTSLVTAPCRITASPSPVGRTDPHPHPNLKVSFSTGTTFFNSIPPLSCSKTDVCFARSKYPFWSS